jgi:AcrR family transcriptional regulator
VSAKKVDGRRERSKRTHAAIVEALTELLDEGRIDPPAAEIAERAGVAVRSIAQHFASREALLLAVAAHHTQRLEQLPHEPLSSRAPLSERLEGFVHERAKELEASRAMRGAAAVALTRSPGVASALQQVAERRRAESARIFSVEIHASPDPRTTERTVALLSSGRAWDALRTELGLSAKAAREQLAASLRSVLGR